MKIYLLTVLEAEVEVQDTGYVVQGTGSVESTLLSFMLPNPHSVLLSKNRKLNFLVIL